MELNTDVWGEIKCFIFPKHLWSKPENILYYKVVKSIPKVNDSNHFTCPPMIVISPPQFPNCFIKLYECFWWTTGERYYQIISFICVSEDESLSQILSDLNQPFYSMSHPLGFYMPSEIGFE